MKQKYLKQFKEDLKMKLMDTSIPEIYSRTLDNNGMIFGANYTNKICKVCMEAVSECLGSIKSTNEPVAFVFKAVNGNFICGAKVEYHAPEDNIADVTSGNWSYVWTYYEDDLKDVNKVVYMDSQLVIPFFITKAGTLYGIKFRDPATAVSMMTTLMESISNWLDDNAKEGEVVEVVEDGVLKAVAKVVAGEIEKSITPEGDAKILVKGDSSIQSI